MIRIGFDTVTAFRIQLNVKLNEIMPLYNKMFDLLYDNDLFGEITKRDGTDNRTTQNTSISENTVNNKKVGEYKVTYEVNCYVTGVEQFPLLHVSLVKTSYHTVCIICLPLLLYNVFSGISVQKQEQYTTAPAMNQ